MLGNYNNSSENECINNEIFYNNLNTDLNNNSVAGNIQFPSGCNPDPSDQLSRSRHSRSGNNHSLPRGNPEHSVQFSRSNSRNNLSPHSNHGEVRLSEQGEHGEVGQLNQYPIRNNPNPTGQPHNGTLARQTDIGKNVEDTPKRSKVEIFKRKLFGNLQVVEGSKDIVPLDTDLEVLLINSCQINAMKVQTIINEFMTERDYSTIFCMTETKVKGHDFQPVGIKMFSKHRGNRDKKGGGASSRL